MNLFEQSLRNDMLKNIISQYSQVNINNQVKSFSLLDIFVNSNECLDLKSVQENNLNNMNSNSENKNSEIPERAVNNNVANNISDIEVLDFEKNNNYNLNINLGNKNITNINNSNSDNLSFKTLNRSVNEVKRTPSSQNDSTNISINENCLGLENGLFNNISNNLENNYSFSNEFGNNFVLNNNLNLLQNSNTNLWLSNIYNHENINNNCNINNNSSLNNVSTQAFLSNLSLILSNVNANNLSKNMFLNIPNLANLNFFNNSKNLYNDCQNSNKYPNAYNINIFQNNFANLQNLNLLYNFTNNLYSNNNNIYNTISDSDKSNDKNSTCLKEGKLTNEGVQNKMHLKSEGSTDSSGSKIYKCYADNCHKVYKSRENLSLHVKNKHLGVKPYTCRYCDAKFSHRNGKYFFNIHLLIFFLNQKFSSFQN